MVKEYELREELESLAREIHAYDRNPITWMNWVKYLLEKLENLSKDTDPSHQQRYVEMLEHLKDAIFSRQSTGSW